MKTKLPFLLLFIFCLVAAIIPIHTNGNGADIVASDVAWLLSATGLVFLMTPGLSFFYGGMVRRKNIISTMLQSFICLGVITIIYFIVGFSLCFGDSFKGIIGNPLTFMFLRNVGLDVHPVLAPTIPFLLFALFQLKFAIITPALITGSFAERVNFKAYVLFISLFTIFIYAPLAHATWHPEGIFRKWGVLDFAGGTVVHMSAGYAALVGAMFLGRRKEFEKNRHYEPVNIPYVLLGTGMLWFGWFGFNGGSALGANATAVQAFATTMAASAAAMMGWVALEMFKGNKPSAMGACIAAVVGLVAITPGCAYVTVPQALFIGFITAVISNFAVKFKNKSNLDDTLDVFPCHGLGGIIGMLLTAVFAKDVGLIYGETTTFLYHLLALAIASLFAFFGSYLLFKVTDFFIPVRVSLDAEEDGLDFSQHGERYKPKRRLDAYL